MQPFPKMNFGTMSQMQANQNQGQTQGQGASTGEGSADSGVLSSVQNSNTFTGANGTTSNAGSLGGCSGGNCNVGGAAQLGASGQFQSQNNVGSFGSGQSQKQGTITATE